MNLSAIISFDENSDPLSMNNIFEADKIELESIFEKTINDIKDDNLKIIAYASTNISAITSFDENFDLISMKNSFEAANFEPEQTFENTINEIKANHLKSITSINMDVSYITSNEPSRLLNI